VAGLTFSSAARSRTVGSRAPGAIRPSAIADSIFAAIVAASAPRPILCTRGNAIVYYNKSGRRFSLGLSRQVWVVEAGVFLNMLGYGAVLPFELIYLHEVRGFSLGVAGLVVGLVTGVAVVTSPIAGAVIDRVGARTTAVVAGLALAGGYASLAFATTPSVAFAAAALAGVGNGGLGPSQSALMAALAPRELRQRASAVSRIAVNFGIGLGAALGGLGASFGHNGFVVLFLANAATYLLYLAILVAAVREDVRHEPVMSGYRQVLRDRALLRFALTNVAMIAVGWGVLAWIVPPYARELGIAPGLIGVLLLANAATVILAQLPIVRAAEGKSRVGALSLGAGTWVIACLLAVVAQAGRPALAFACLVVAAIAFGIGECLHATAFMPLVADLAPPALRGRYMAAAGLSWWVGLAAAPTLGGQLLAVSPPLALMAGAALAALAIALLRVFETALPVGARLIPRPESR
jgi:MFS family permease